MSTAASIYFSPTQYDIKYVQIQNISTTTAVLYGHVLYLYKNNNKNSRVQITCNTVAFRFFLAHIEVRVP